MTIKSWDDLLWLYLTGELTPEDRRLFEQYLASSATRRAELAEWELLREVVREEAAARARGRHTDDLPPLNAGQYMVAMPAPVSPSSNGRHPVDLPERRQPDFIMPVRRTAGGGSSLTILVAAAAVLLIGGLLLAFLLVENDMQTAARNTDTPTASVTHLPSTVPTSTPLLPLPSITFDIEGVNNPPAVTATPLEMQVTLVPPVTFPPGPPVAMPDIQPTQQPTVPPPGFGVDPRASVTPGQGEPRLNATAVSSGRLPMTDVIRDVVWSPAGDAVAVPATEGVYVYSPDDLNIVTAFYALAQGAVSVAYSPDGDYLAALDWNATLWLVDTTQGEVVVEVPVSGLWGDLIFWAENIIVGSLSSAMVQVGEDGAYTIFVEQTAYPFYSPSGTLAVTNYLQAVEDMATAANATATMIPPMTDTYLVDVRTGQTLHIFENLMGNPSAAFNSEETRLLLQDGVRLRVFDVESGNELASAEVEGRVDEVALTDTLVAFITATNTQLFKVWLWDYAEAAPVEVASYDVPFSAVAFSPDGAKLAITTSDGRVIVLDVSEG
ncbi:MAG: hypothetical protein OHK0046_02930 [Anaerolineae bacterium]